MRQQTWKDIYIDKGVNIADHKPHSMNKYMRKKCQLIFSRCTQPFLQPWKSFVYQEECAGPITIPPSQE